MFTFSYLPSFANPNKVHKVIMKKDNTNHIFTVSVDSFKFGEENLITIVFLQSL